MTMIREPAFERGAAGADSRQGSHRAKAVAARKSNLAASQTSLTAWFVAIAVTCALLAGYMERDSWGLTPGHGTGYWIGIAGAVGLVATLGYPVRKYWRRLRNAGTVAGWFKVHMLLGIFAPAVVLFHSNFHLGALNSNVALYAMLCVAGSGIIGRYLYRKIHQGLQGNRSDLRDMIARSTEMRRALGGDLPQNSPMWSELLRLEAKAREPSRGLAGALVNSVSLAYRANAVRRNVARDARAFIDTECRSRRLTHKQRRIWHKVARNHLETYFNTVKATARLIVFERLFAVWHLLHVPVFILMAISAAVHVVAVHFY